MRTSQLARIPHTKRPALLHRLPASHNLILAGIKNPQKARTSLAGFVTHSFGYLYGTRLQFWDWWQEGRVPIKSTINLRINSDSTERFLSKAIVTWKRLDRRSRLVASNLLYFHCKAGAAEWDWERFHLEYTVTDACFAIAKEKDGCHANRHADRIRELCSTYGLVFKPKWVSLFVRLRNELFPEALWDRGHPNSPRKSMSIMAAHHLRRFNHRLIAAIFAGPSDYTKSAWWYIDPDTFTI